MAQFDRQAHWIVTENIARFQEQLKSMPDASQRKILEGLLLLEREKLRTMSSLPNDSLGAAAGKALEHDQAEKKQDDGSPQEY